ncbi:MAG: methyltransferase domain-containing protein, partial [Candidatus Omnitrophota bacterium]
NSDKEYLEVSYNISDRESASTQRWLDKMARSLDFLAGRRFDTNNPEHLKALRNFVEKGLLKLDISPEVWSLNEERLENNILRDLPKELKEFSQQMPRFYRHIIKNDSLRRMVTYGNVFKANSQFDKDRVNTFENENIVLVNILRKEHFSDSGFWKRLQPEDFKKQPIEIFVAQREYFKEAGREDLLDALESPVLWNRLTGQIIIVPHVNGNPFELLLEIMEKIYWLKFNSNVAGELIRRNKGADFGAAFIDEYMASCWRHAPVWSCKKVMGGFIANEILKNVGSMGMMPFVTRNEINGMFGADDSWKEFFYGSHEADRGVLMFNKAWEDLVKNKENVIQVKYLPLVNKWEELQVFMYFMRDCGNYSLIPALDEKIGLPLKGFVSFIYAKEALRLVYEADMLESGIPPDRVEATVEEIIWRVIINEAAAGRIDYSFFEQSMLKWDISFPDGKIRIAAQRNSVKDGGTGRLPFNIWPIANNLWLAVFAGTLFLFNCIPLGEIVPYAFILNLALAGSLALSFFYARLELGEAIFSRVTGNMSGQDKISEFYRFAGDGHTFDDDPAAVRSFISFLGIEEGSAYNIVHVGCGKAGIISNMAQKYDMINCVGIDCSDSPLRRAKKNLRAIKAGGTESGVELMLGLDYAGIALKDNWADIVIVETMEHTSFNDAQKGFREYRRILKNGGKLFVILSDSANITNLRDYLGYPERLGVPVSVWFDDDLRRTAESCGFRLSAESGYKIRYSGLTFPIDFYSFSVKKDGGNAPEITGSQEIKSAPPAEQNIFDDPEASRELILKDVKLFPLKEYNGRSFVCVLLNNMCTVGCEFCCFRSLRHSHAHRQELLVQAGNFPGVIRFLNSANIGHLLLSSFGEIFEHPEAVYKITERVNAGVIILVTNGAWAREENKCNEVVGRLYEAFRKNKYNAKIILRVSLDQWHKEKLGIEHILNLIRLFEAKYRNAADFELQFRSVIGDETSEELRDHLYVADEQDITKSFHERVSGDCAPDMTIKPYFKEIRITLRSGYSFICNALPFYNADLKASLLDPEKTAGNIAAYDKEVKILNLGKPAIAANTSGQDGLDMEISPDGAIHLWHGDCPDNKANILRNTLSEVREKFFSDPIALSFVEKGCAYREEIVSEVNPRAVIRAKAIGIREIIGSRLLEEEKTRLYLSIRVLQDYIREGRVFVKDLPDGIQRAVSLDKDTLIGLYHRSRYSIVDQYFKNPQINVDALVSLHGLITLGHYDVTPEQMVDRVSSDLSLSPSQIAEFLEKTGEINPEEVLRDGGEERRIIPIEQVATEDELGRLESRDEGKIAGYALVFDPRKSVAEHIEKVKELKRGEFNEDERKQLIAMGLLPDSFSPLFNRYLQIFLYAYETDRSHEGLILLVDGVITARGGYKSHAFSFCRESEIPVMTGAGQVSIDGRDLRTGDGLILNAVSERFYKMPQPRPGINPADDAVLNDTNGIFASILGEDAAYADEYLIQGLLPDRNREGLVVPASEIQSRAGPARPAVNGFILPPAVIQGGKITLAVKAPETHSPYLNFVKKYYGEIIATLLTVVEIDTRHSEIIVSRDIDNERFIIDLTFGALLDFSAVLPESTDGGEDLRAAEELRKLAATEFFKRPLDARINRCHELRLEWEGILSREQLSQEDITRMQVITTEIISQTPFEADVNTVNPKRLIFLYQRVTLLAKASYEKTKKQAAIAPDPSQSREFLFKTAKFAYCSEYGRLYQLLIRLLNVVGFYRSRLPQPSPELEKGLRRYIVIARNSITGILNVIYPLWGFTLHEWLVSSAIPKTRDSLYSIGNLIVPGLYLAEEDKNGESIEAFIPSEKIVFVSGLTPEEDRIEVGVEQKFSYKVAGLAYFVPFYTAFQELFWTAAHYFWGYGNSPDYGRSSANIFASFAVYLALHNAAIYFTDKFSKEHGPVINRYLSELEAVGLKDYNRRLFKEEYARLWRSWNKEMHSKEAGRSVDLVIIVSDTDQKYSVELGRIWRRKDVPILAKHVDSNGSGLAYLSAARHWDLDEDLGDLIRKLLNDNARWLGPDGRKHHLFVNKPLKDSRVVIILATKELFDDRNRVLPFPVPGDPNLLLNSVEFALLNCIRASRMIKKHDKSGLVIH